MLPDRKVCVTHGGLERDLKANCCPRKLLRDLLPPQRRHRGSFTEGKSERLQDSKVEPVVARTEPCNTVGGAMELVSAN